MSLTITAADLRRFAPKAKEIYTQTLLEHVETLEDAGILENHFRLAHFLAQVGAETAGLTLLREKMNYKPARLRVVWPSRFKNKTDGELAALVADPVKLADAVYGGRMGNKKGTSDGYDFRGGGWLQITGRYNVEKFCAELGVEANANTLDDVALTLRFACLEWKKSGCNAWADKNDVLRVSKIINVGSAESGVMPNGMDDRKFWLGQALKVWSQNGQARPLAEVADIKPADLDSRTIRDATATKIVGGSTVATALMKAVHEANALVPVAPPSLPSLPEIADNIGMVEKVAEGITSVAKFAMTNYWIAGLVIGALIYWLGHQSVQRYLEDIRTGKRQPVFKITRTIAEAVG